MEKRTGFFWQRYNEPGPGVDPNEPRKKGIRRFFELMVQDAGNLVKLSLIYQGFILPAQLLFLFFIYMGSAQPGMISFLFLALFLGAAIVIGPATTARVYCLAKMLMDSPGFLWHDFWKAFKENFRSTAITGIIYASILAIQAYMVFAIFLSSGPVNYMFMVSVLVSIILFSMLTPYYFLQAAYLDQSQGVRLKNTVFLSFGHIKRSFIIAVVDIVFWGSCFFLQELVAIPVVLIGYSLSALIRLMCIWPPVDNIFSIEETLKNRSRAQLGGKA